jgi:hypothetical protein
MKITEEDLKRIRKILSDAYGSGPAAPLGGAWRAGVMDHIRRLPSREIPAAFGEQFYRIVWRLVPAACILILILGITLFTTEFFPEYELAKQFIEHPTAYTVARLLGVGV